MADLYPPSYSTNRQYDYPPIMSAGSSNNSDDDNHTSPEKNDPPKPEAKPQATFLTKLYASVPFFSPSCLELIHRTKSLLERQENQHMIRWDPAGEHIIVERPEQLALHVLPSIYRQSRFASFSRQLNVCSSPASLFHSSLTSTH